MKHEFILCDVFTDRAFGGNQLAVFPDATGIPENLLQVYAREINFSETTFVLPPRKPGHTHRVRIFTPTQEIAFAGHPNVGTGAVLAARTGGAAEFVFDEDVGTVRVAARPTGATITAELTLERAPEIRPVDIATERLAAMVSLTPDRLAGQAAWMASVGLPFFCLPLTDFGAVTNGRLDMAVWEKLLPPGTWARDVYVVAGDFSPGGRLKARMWAPADGVPEDPATGSAAAMLVGSLATRLPQESGVFSWTIEQGAEIGRPSLIQASAEKRDGAVVALRVGGGVAIVGDGAFYARS